MSTHPQQPSAQPASAAETIRARRTSLGIELGSTRIKAVLIGPDHATLATGVHDWENEYVDRVWTYSEDAIWSGLQDCFSSLAADVRRRHGVQLTGVGSLGVSAMMHGYLPFGADDELLVPFRTWRNTSTGRAADELSELFGVHLPVRWSIAHLHQALLDDEPHVGRIARLTTLAGYVHWRLSGEFVLGVGDASGMFPIDAATGTWDEARMDRYEQHIASRATPWSLRGLLPTVLPAGHRAGVLTAHGAALLDSSGTLEAGAPMAPPEGDAGTGMVATNAVAPGTGHVSAGTSIFAMIVLNEPLSRVHDDIDVVTTPAGEPVAMVHCNNGASELSTWASLFGEFATLAGPGLDSSRVYELLFEAAGRGAADAGGLLAYNFLSGEHNLGLDEGRPMVVRGPDSELTLANLIRAELYAVFGALRMGMDSLAEEHVEITTLLAQGGLFQTKQVAQRLLAGALKVPVSVGDTAAEGGAWGMAVLAAFAATDTAGTSLAEHLADTVFRDLELVTVQPDPDDVAGFDAWLERFVRGLAIEKAAVEHS
ncbi:xylulokinase [Tersicoccus sp. Bi-70]|uniref:xylulokinase n=1 Tax=Tersicoccus sp. Bi-70 TaxID=1897634 RepID=UPI0009762469|nr:FGGY-family carbohydrate kinase [Tersicoccus sp. Bi-70]OMH37093.1 ATPase [Tersicoccus sp. Bi-70]